jgi:hypothetical protein
MYTKDIQTMNAGPPLTHSARRINYLATQLKATKYLEVGVAKGRTFFGVRIDRKVAVDPSFQFDVADYRSDSVRFFEVVSDRYFLEHAGAERFDIIFLDGLHTFEQTLRDFCNSLSFSHERTVWVIDDTLPIDVYSAIKEQRKALQARKDAGGQSLAWHGDVYKIVFALHDLFPCFSYCTLSTQGNPQTLIWKCPRRDFSPKYDSLEVVSRLSYFDLRENLSVLNLVSEEVGLEGVAAALRE